MAAHRIPSLPIPTEELLDMLRADGDEQLLDFGALEWVLDTEVELPNQADEALSGLPTAPAPPGLAPAGPDLLAQPTTLQPGWSAGNGFDKQVLEPKPEPVQPASSGEHSHVNLPMQPPQLLLGAQLPSSFQLPLQHSGDLGSGSSPVAQQVPAPHLPPAARSSFSTRPLSTSSSFEETAEAGAGHPPPKKKRTRNAEQMAQNRIAQQKYRERKKQEHEQLQSALDQLTAQLAAMKAMEARTAVLQSENQMLLSTTHHQAARIAELTQQVEVQSIELAAAKHEAAQSAALVSSQQAMILDQHNKLKLQEEVIEALRGRLKDKMDAAFEGHDPQTVCQRMIQAVRAALAGAKNVEGLQAVLEQLPDDVVTSICKSILCEVKSMWPELAARLHSLKMCTNYRCGETVCAS